MKVLFLSLLDFSSIYERSIYTDLLREFVAHGHEVYAISPEERKKKTKTRLINGGGIEILKLKIGNIQKTNIIEKGLSTIFIESQMIQGIRKFFANTTFDLVLYTTPPITFYKAIRCIKKRDGAKTYLMLKDIFPQNAVDMGMLSVRGLKGIVYRYFRYKEKRLYEVSDIIGCMSQANVDYLLANNSKLSNDKVEICPNSVEPLDLCVNDHTRKDIRIKYEIPLDKKVFVYGGNLGKPQGIDFLIDCLRSQLNEEQVFFLIIGDGTEYGKLASFVANEKPDNIKLMRKLPKEDYDILVAACDVGMIFLDYRFTIPNFPSRLLSYMQAKIPVLAVTDCNTDIGQAIIDGEFGWWCESNDVNSFISLINKISSNNQLDKFGLNAWHYLNNEYSVEKVYSIIMKHCC